MKGHQNNYRKMFIEQAKAKHVIAVGRCCKLTCNVKTDNVAKCTLDFPNNHEI